MENSISTQENETVHFFFGTLQVSVTSLTTQIPIPSAFVTISYQTSEEASEEHLTDQSGQTSIITLSAPDPAFSLSPSPEKPYSNYTITVTARQYEPITIEGCEILPNSLSLLHVEMRPLSTSPSPEVSPETITIPDHILYGSFPEKLPEAEIKPIPETSEIVLSRVVIPEYIIVHDGIPSDKSAKNYWVRYKDYIKNVASSEIYSTWPEAAIYANILAIMSITLNRVYTEWYRGQGYDFTITSSTAYDQKWIYGRNTFEKIDYLVDSVFNNYLSRPGILQPLFASYCDGQKVNCTGLKQWGSKYLADKGYSALEILRYYYGSNLFIQTATQISGVPSSYPGYVLTTGSRGDKVLTLQRQLNRISQNYPAIPKVTADGVYGPKTKEAVSIFQGIFHLPKTGNTDFATWYQISSIYVGVTRISEPDRA